ncbi:MAG: Endonuclease III [Promethearchaeota archaeon]|nr:MAG: Endonuclease III [Candidatus Lokiarchaeota archaeon]
MNFKEFFDQVEDSLEGYVHLDELARNNQNPFKILISTVLSARTRDTNTRKVTEKLFNKYNTPKELAEVEIEELEGLIYESGFYRIKSKRIKEISKIIHEKYNDKVPDTYKELKALPGVGHKTANCVLNYAFKKAAICVDTHVHRISNRLGWVHTKTPKKTEIALKKVIPKDIWIRVNHAFVKFGQQICLPNNPKHDICPVEEICEKDFSMEKMKKKK